VAGFEISLQTGEDGTAVLSLDTNAPTEQFPDRRSLGEAVLAAARDAFERQGVRRIEARIAADDELRQRAVLWAGFRLEGRRRQAVGTADGSRVDELIFARLDTDAVHGPDGFSGVANSTMPRKRLIAHVLMRSADGRVLLCETQFKADWELPGGIVEPNESPRIGAIREVKEELGIDIDLGPLLAVDWMPPYLGWDDAVELIFDGGIVTEEEIAAYALQPNEIKTVRLIDLPAAEPYLTPLSFRRLTAITALNVPRTLTMEAGLPV
jgi:8-oxo-dGTP pyrophosphatase MutT (NUDIX family)